MLFTEPRFLVFFLMVLLLTWALRRPGIRALLLWVADALRRYETRKLLLLVASYVFYGA